MANAVIEWAKDHPYAAGGAALAVVVVVMLVSGGGSGSQDGADASGGMGGAGLQAYYAAVAQQNQAGAAVQIAEVQAQAKTNQTLIAASYGLERDKVVSASSDYAVTTNAGVQRDALFIQGKQIDAWREVELNKTNQEANQFNQGIALGNSALSQKNLGKEQRGAIVQAAITGKVVPVSYKAPNPGNSASAVISSVGNAAGNILGSIF